MKLLTRFKNFFRREKGATPKHTPREGGIPLWLYPYAGTGMNVATVYACVKFLSESVANLPIRYMKRRGNVLVSDETSYLDYLFNVSPDTAHTGFEMWRKAVQNLLLEGNAYIVPFYDGHELTRLALCGPGTVSHDTLQDIYTIADPINGVSGTFTEDEVIHIKNLTGVDPKRGISVLTYARMAIGIASAADNETEHRFTNGGTVKGIISNDKPLRGWGEYQDAELKKMAAVLDRRFNVDGENIVAVAGQTEFSQISMSSVDMQFLESRKFTVREICRFFGVHPSFVFDDTSNNYKSAEQANVAFLSHTLSPLLRCIENELNRKLIAKSLHGKRLFRFDRHELYACDLDGLMKYRLGQLQLGTTVNEIRQQANLPPVEGGDRVFVSANLRDINETPETPADTTDQDDGKE